MMEPVIVIQLMTVAVFLAVAFQHALIWSRGHQFYEHLLFAATSLAAVGNVLAVTGVYRATSVDGIIAPFKLSVLFAAFWLIALTWFMATYSQADRPRRWWAAIQSAVFLAIAAVDGLSPGGWFFSTITGIRQTHIWGGRLALPAGPLSGRLYVSDLALLGLLAFVVDGSVRLWRRQSRRRAVLMGGSIVLFIVIYGDHGQLLQRGFVEPPYLDAYAFLLVVLAMSYELAGDVVKAAVLTRQVEANERRWRSLLEGVQLLVIGLGETGVIEYVNPYAARLLGYPVAELSGQTWSERFVPETDRAAFQRDFKQVLQERHLPRSENRIVTRAGTELHIHWSNVLMRDPQGNVSGLLAIGEDVTARWQAETEIRQLRDELAHLNRLSAMGEVAASLAHELYQPLTAILSNAQVAQRSIAAEPLDRAEIDEILRDIVEDDRRAAAIINRLRVLVKKAGLVFVPLDLVAVVQDVAALLRSDIVLRQVQVTIQPDPDVPRVKGDRIQLQQVVLNLLLNAFDAMKDYPPAERQVSVWIERHGPDAVRVMVRDHGVGLADDKLASIFQPFYTTKEDGLGMGLAISRSIIEAHGGELLAENNPDRGAAFWFTVPVNR